MVATVVDLCKQSKVVQISYWYVHNEPLYTFYLAIRIVVRMVVLRSNHCSIRTHGSFVVVFYTTHCNFITKYCNTFVI